MFKFLSKQKEVITKKSLLSVLIESICGAIVSSWLLYICLTNGNEFIVEFFSSAAKNKIELEITLIMFPILLIIITTLKLMFFYVVNNDNLIEKNKKTKK